MARSKCHLDWRHLTSMNLPVLQVPAFSFFSELSGMQASDTTEHACEICLIVKADHPGNVGNGLVTLDIWGQFTYFN